MDRDTEIQAPTILEKIRTAFRLLRENQLADAYGLCEAVLAAGVRDPHALHIMGLVAFQCRNDSLGVRLLEEAIALRPDYAEARANLVALGGDSVARKYLAEVNNQTGEAADDARLPQEGNIGDWRHMRMLDFAACFAGRPERWLTIGDAYGHDSIRLRRHGVAEVVASNLTAAHLRSNHEAGFINEFREINAEGIDYPDNSFDYVLCKEALHHMPRPMLAIYEMLRVARVGVFLIEPQDPVIDLPKIRDNQVSYQVEGFKLSTWLPGAEAPAFEVETDWSEKDVGNYVYTLSRREMQKLCFGLDLPLFCSKTFCDYFEPEISTQPAVPGNEALARTIEQITMAEQLVAANMIPATYLTVGLFKTVPAPDLRAALEQKGFTFNGVPKIMPPLRWPSI